jgi:hypothetical protein
MPFECPLCFGKTGVLETRHEKRRRRCLTPTCNYTFMTQEVWFTPEADEPDIGVQRVRDYRARKKQEREHAQNPSA